MDTKREKRLDFIVNLFFWSAICSLVVLGCKYLIQWMLPVIAGYVVAMLIHPVAQQLTKDHPNKTGAVGSLLLVAAYLLFGLLLTLTGAAIVGWIQRLLVQLPSLYRTVLLPAASALDSIADRIFALVSPQLTGNAAVQLAVGEVQTKLVLWLTQSLGHLGAFGVKLPDMLFTCLVSIICSMLITNRYQEITAFVHRQCPPAVDRFLHSLKQGALTSFSALLQRVLILSVVTAMELMLGLWLLGVEQWFVIALLLSLLDVLPFVGVGGGILPWTVVVVLKGNLPMAAGLLFLWGIVAVTHGVLDLKLTGAQLNLHPLAATCALYLGYRIAGVWGMLLFPMAAALIVQLQRTGQITLWK